MAYKDLNTEQRIIAVHLDIMKHKDFSLMGGVTQIGKVHVVASTKDLEGLIEHLAVPTACTNGCDVWYNTQFVKEFTRKQLRYLVLHENFHKALHHCTEYRHLAQRYPEIFAKAIDYVTNDQIETIDPSFDFVERPTNCKPLIDDKYHDMSVPQVMKMLLDEEKDGGGKGKDPKGGGQPGDQPGPMDTHILREPGTGSGKLGDEDAEGGLSKEALKQQLQDAVNQGAIVSKRLRGQGGGGQSLSGFQERHTDWRTPTRQFVQEMCEGDEQSRYSPLNKRLQPLGIILPSHYSEATGELIIACDTSGSMGHLYPVVFGEIARICVECQPKGVRIIWWGDHIEGEQVFEPKDYDKIKDLMKPKGGGGTTVSCVAKHIQDNNYRPKAVIYLTDGYVESQYDVAAGPVLWGVVDNPGFVPIRGKKIDISSMDEGR